MASHVRSADAAAFVERATLANLLALRVGGPITLSSPQSWKEDDHIDEALESVADTASPAPLHEVRGKLYDRFLNRISDILSAERNGRFVTAAILKESEPEPHVDIWVARNNGFKADADQRWFQRWRRR